MSMSLMQDGIQYLIMFYAPYALAHCCYLTYILQMSFSFTLNIYTFFVPLFHLAFLPFLIFFFLPSLLLPPSLLPSPSLLPPSQDLLQLQYEGLAIMKMFERAKINVNLLIYLINKKFYGRV